VFLFADCVRFREPRFEFGVDVARFLQTKNVEVVSWRESLYRAKPRILDTPSEHDVTVKPAAARSYLCKRHSDVECYASFFRQNFNRSQFVECGDYCVERLSHLRLFTDEVAFQIVKARACVSLVAVRERSLTAWTLP
jgi:hypothetical protein